MTPAPANIAILVFPETSSSVVYGMYDLFKSAGRDWGILTDGVPGPGLIRPMLVARQDGPVRVSNDVFITPHTTLAQCPDAEIVCVPEVALAPGEPLGGRLNAEIAWLKERYERGASLASACSGSLLFAAAGLLDGWEATIHWGWCDSMREQFPAVTVHDRRALVVSGDGQRLIMGGGGTSWLDVALYLIARTVGVEAAMQVARLNLIDWHQIGQQPFARLTCTRQVEDSVIARCQTWVAEHYQERAPVNAMVRLSGLAERTFKRRFRQATGMSALEYVHALRLEEAKQMLEASDLPIEAIANEVGYEDSGFFSRLFKRKVNLTPAQYRKRFGSLREKLSIQSLN
ncbi:MAG TPA: helix-turn-helix domain-containing protein [Gammaproteobacteria bacterium]|nr:helix-turn-helix domain-containing protein [Gammaproteobacteria bacterium]